MEDYSFYFNLADALVANLSNEEKTAASLWLTSLRKIDDELALKYTKLFIFFLQKSLKKSAFGRPPPESPEKFLEILENSWDSLQSSQKNSHSDDKSSGICASISSDWREYFALQEINDTLLHGYYGISVDGPLLKNERGNLDIESLSDDNHRLLTDEIEEIIKNNKIESQENLKKSCKCCDNGKSVVSNKTRPCWGRNRYMERLIDQSPHSAGDLDAVGVNAMLQNIQNHRKK